VRGCDLTGGPSSVAALAYLSIMSPTHAAEALRARAIAIGGEVRQLQEALDGAETAEIHMIEVHYLLSRLRHDMQWLTGTAHRIETGELAWPRTSGLPAAGWRLNGLCMSADGLTITCLREQQNRKMPKRNGW
jgi:hypothetical protein